MRHLLTILIFVIHSFGCGWVNGTTIDGHWVERSGGRISEANPDQLAYALESTPEQMLHYLDESFSKDDRENNITKAVLFMLDGNYKESIKKLLIQEALHDNSYEVATNLGTAYELSGDNSNALKWIKEGIKRNPDSHYGTEWLHVKILETKLKLEDDPDYLQNNHVVDFEELYYNTYKYREAIFYQLRERMLFVKPKDPLVADLLYAYAIVNSENGGFLEYSREALELSEKYGYSNLQELAEIKKEYQNIIDHVALIENLKLVGYVAVFFLLLFIAYKKKWFFISRKAQNEYLDKLKLEVKTEQNIKKKSETSSSKKKNGIVLIIANIIYLLVFLPFLLILTSVAVAYINSYIDVLDDHSGLVKAISILITLLLEFLYMRHYDKFLREEDLKIKEIRYGLDCTGIGVLSIISVPLIMAFGFQPRIEVGLYIFFTGAFFIIGLFLVNSGLKQRKTRQEEQEN